jgi:hypothetical protein
VLNKSFYKQKKENACLKKEKRMPTSRMPEKEICKHAKRFCMPENDFCMLKKYFTCRKTFLIVSDCSGAGSAPGFHFSKVRTLFGT